MTGGAGLIEGFNQHRAALRIGRMADRAGSRRDHCELFLLEMVLEMGAVIKNNPCPAAKRIVFERRMPVGKTGELSGVAALALKVTQPGEIMPFSLMFDMAGGAGQSSFPVFWVAAQH